MSEELLLSRYERAWNRHDHHACAACFTETGAREFLVVWPCGEPGDAPHALEGRRAIAADIGLLMRAVPDLSVEVVSAGYASDRRLWTEWRVRGTHTGDLGRWHADGRRIEVLGVSVFRLSNAGFLEERVYWDTAFVRGRREGLPGLRPALGESGI